jgi:hypothetical protein
VQKDNNDNIDAYRLNQQRRLLQDIEKSLVTCSCEEELKKIVDRYFSMTYNDSPQEFISSTITYFKRDLLLTDVDCTEDDKLRIVRLKQDIYSTFRLIITRSGDYSTFFDKIEDIELGISKESASVKLKRRK